MSNVDTMNDIVTTNHSEPIPLAICRMSYPELFVLPKGTKSIKKVDNDKKAINKRINRKSRKNNR